MSKTQPNPVKNALPVIATLFVVAGVAAIVMSRPLDEPKGVPIQEVTATSTPQAYVAYTGPDGLHVIASGENASSERVCTLPAGGGDVERLTQEGVVVALASGQKVTFGFDCEAMGTSPGARLVDTSEDDAVGKVVFSDGTHDEVIALRGANNRPYLNPILVGWLKADTLAVIAFQNGARHALAVNPTGVVTPLGELPETATEFGVGDGAFWYVQASPGQGIEFGPRGPSEIHRIGTDGKDAMIVRDADNAMEAFLPGPGGRVTYLSGGSVYIGQQSGVKNIGTGRPVGWMEDGTVLVLRDGKLTMIAADGVVADTNVAIPDGIPHVWRTTLDEPAATQ
jgi:hypothetical protein